MKSNQFKEDFTDTIDVSNMDVRGRILSNVKIVNSEDVDCLGLVVYHCRILDSVRNALVIGCLQNSTASITIKKDIEDLTYKNQYVSNVEFQDIMMLRCVFTNSKFENVSFFCNWIECCDFINCEFVNCTFDSYYVNEEPISFIWMASCDFTGSTFTNCSFYGDSESPQYECESGRKLYNNFTDIAVISEADPRITFDNSQYYLN